MSHDPIRVRFAPSPTGYLHIGGVRTALYNWLYARGRGGKFLIRIEDTDTERSEQRFTDDILASLRWLGFDWDEELAHQSGRFEHYRARAETLLAKGFAYKCYCSEAELEEMRAKAQAAGRKPMYDRTCRERLSTPPGDAPFVIRARLPLEGTVEFEDLIRGRIGVSNGELDDFVIVRSNGSPTYNFVVVVDDVEFKMTHIVRGDDHLNNTPKQIHLYRAFDYPVPAFAHLPMILGQDKKKLSKRHGDVSANWYRGEGYLPEALLNFLVRLGWSHGDQEIFSVEEMKRYFDFDHVQKSAAVFNTEKLLWVNASHLRAASSSRVAAIVAGDFKEYFAPAALERVRTPLGEQLIELIQPKVQLVKEIAEQLVPLCTAGPLEIDVSEVKWGKKNDVGTRTVIKAALARATSQLAGRVSERVRTERTGEDAVWGSAPSLGDLGLAPSEIDSYFRQLGAEFGLKLGDLAQPMRLAVTGRLVSAGLFEVLSLLPWDTVEARLDKIQEF